MKKILIILLTLFSIGHSAFGQFIFFDVKQNLIQDTLIIVGENQEYNFTIPSDSIQIRVVKCDTTLEYSMIEITHTGE